LSTILSQQAIKRTSRRRTNPRNKSWWEKKDGRKSPYIAEQDII